MSRRKKILAIPLALSRYLLMIGVIGFISLLCPNELRFKYQYELGSRWGYEDLTAPFDIPLLKNQQQLEEERIEVREEFSPYYRLDPGIGKRQKKAFEDDFDRQLAFVSQEENSTFKDVLKRPGVYRSYGSNLLDRIFNRGIIELAPFHKDKSKDFVVNILRSNTFQRQTLQNIPDLDQVSGWLGDTLLESGLREAEFLISVLDENLAANLVYDDSLTKRMLEAELWEVLPTRGLVDKGEVLVKKGDLITEETYQKLLSFEARYKQEVSVQNSFWRIFSGHVLLTTLVVGVLLLYLLFNEKRVFRSFRSLLFIATWLVAYSYLTYVVEGIDVLSAYLIPFCIVPIVIKNFFNERLALFTHIVIVMIASFLSTLGYEFTFLHILAGIVAVLTNTETRYWSRFFLSMLYIFLVYVIGFFGLSLIQEGDWATIDWRVFIFFFLNVLFTLLAYPLIPLLEKLFGFTSSITLAELADLNRPLLKQLSMKAPGTMQHSLQVAHLSEAAARRIGADSLLVKTAALYHDIGKMKNPRYFIENQSGDSPHNELEYMESARIIIGHVEEGVKMARKNRLPQVLVDFIRTHHGTTRVEYFYRSFIKDHPDEEVDESAFRYPGPKPLTKEQTIMMMADSLEAASKSLKQPHTGQDIDELVDKIVAGKIAQGQFEESMLTFDELEHCKEEFKSLLRSINHVRIEYPEEQERPVQG